MDVLLAQKVSRIGHRLSTILRIATGLSVAVGITLLGLAFISPGLLEGWVARTYPQVIGLSPSQILMLVVLALGQLALTAAALWELAQMFDRVARDEPLSQEAAMHMRRASRWLLCATIYAMLVQIPGSLIASYHMPEGSRFIALGLSSSHASGVLASLVLYAVASIQDLAAQVRDDNRQII